MPSVRQAAEAGGSMAFQIPYFLGPATGFSRAVPVETAIHGNACMDKAQSPSNATLQVEHSNPKVKVVNTRR